MVALAQLQPIMRATLKAALLCLVLSVALYHSSCFTYVPIDLPEIPEGNIRIRVRLVNAFPAVELKWKGTWSAFTQSPPHAIANSNTEAEGTAALAGTTSGHIEELVGEHLRVGLWEFVVSATVAGGDPFPPVVCRQEIRDGQEMLLDVTEGQFSCVSLRGGGEQPKVFLWGETGAGFANPGRVGPQTSEAYPDVADGTGDINYLFLLVRQGTNVDRASSIKVAFYAQDTNRPPGCTPSTNCLPGNRLSASVFVNVHDMLRDRGRLRNNATTGEQEAAGNTWLFFPLDGPAHVLANQTIFLGILDPCAGTVCDPATPSFLTVAANLRNSFQSAAGGETELPNPWPAANNTFTDAPIAAFGLHRDNP